MLKIRYSLLSIFVVVLLFSGIKVMYGSETDVSYNHERVNDEAKFFRQSEIQELEQLAKVDPEIEFYIYTTNSISNEDTASYAAQLFKKQKLGQSDVLIVLSKEDRRIAVNYSNTAFLSEVTLPDVYIDKTHPEEKTLDRLIRVDFLPFAGEKNYAGGLITFIHSFREASHTQTVQIQPPETVNADNKTTQEESTQETEVDKLEPSSGFENLKRLNSHLILIIGSMLAVLIVFQVTINLLRMTSYGSRRSSDSPTSSTMRISPSLGVARMQDGRSENSTESSTGQNDLAAAIENLIEDAPNPVELNKVDPILQTDNRRVIREQTLDRNDNSVKSQETPTPHSKRIIR